MPLQEFEFEVSTAQLVPLLQQMLRYVQQQVTLPAPALEAFLFETKIILTELLTNAIKHTGNGLVQFNIEINNTGLLITKTDKGPPIKLLHHPGFTKPGDVLQVTNDIMHTLLATLEARQTLRFTYTEHELPALPDAQQLHDHFGLLLIAKAADECRYCYNAEEKTNVFAVKKLIAL